MNNVSSLMAAARVASLPPLPAVLSCGAEEMPEKSSPEKMSCDERMSGEGDRMHTRGGFP